MYKTSVYTHVNGNIYKLAHWKRQKLLILTISCC